MGNNSENKLMCKCCFNSFDDKDKEPKLLPCFHVFCKSPCLERLAAQDPERKTLTCPTCKYRVILPENGVTGLRTDFQVLRLLKHKEARERAERLMCDNCKKSSAVKYCCDCKQLMCDKCGELHETWEAFSNHKLRSTEDVRSDPVKELVPVNQPLMCEKHKQMELRMYCDTCSELICSDCTFRFHKNHDYDVMNDAFATQREQLILHLKPFREQLHSVEHALETLTTRENDIRKQTATIEELIKTEIDQLCHLLCQRKEKLLTSLENHTKQNLHDLASQKDNVDATHEIMRSCLEYADAGLKTCPGTEGEVLRMKKPVLERIKEITAEFDSDAIQPKTEADIELRTNDRALRACQEFGEVICHFVSPENSYITGDGTKISTKDKQTAVELHPISAENCNIEQEFKLTAELAHTRSAATTTCLYTKEENGRHTITYRPVNRGRHSLHIRVNCTHIRGSPFSIAVTPSLENLRTPAKVWLTSNHPYGIAVNSSRQIVFTEQNEDCVSLVNAEGQTIACFGRPGSRSGQLKAPCGVTVDQSDNIYVVDNSNHRIQKFSPEGSFIDAAGSRGAGTENDLNFRHPFGICFNKANDLLYVCDHNNHRIQVLTTELTFVNSFGENGRALGQFNCPTNLAFDSANNLYVTDRNNNRVQVFTAEGEYLRSFFNKANGETLCLPTAIAIDSGNVIYVSECDLNCVSLFTSEGKYITSFGGPGSQDGQFNGIHGLYVDQDDSIYVADFHNKKIQIF